MKQQVLLVDESTLVLSGLRRALYEEDFETWTESSPEQALKVVARGAFDIVISDHDMPGMNGGTFLAEVRKLDPTIVRFMLTGKATLDMAIAAINEGTVHRFFTKPCNHVDLAVSIRGALEQRTLLAESRKLLWLYRRQEARIEKIERAHPNLTVVERDETGPIPFEDMPTDGQALHDLMTEIFARSESPSAGA